MAMMIPEEFGGAGLDTISYVLVLEEFSRVCASTGVCVSVNNSLFSDGVYKFGNQDVPSTIIWIRLRSINLVFTQIGTHSL